MAAVSVLPGELSHHPHQLLSVTERDTMWPGRVRVRVFSGQGQPKTAAPPQSQNPSCAPAVACCGDKLLLGACGEERERRGDFELLCGKSRVPAVGHSEAECWEMGYRTVGRKQPALGLEDQFLWGRSPPVPLGDWTSSDSLWLILVPGKDRSLSLSSCENGSVCLATVSTRIQRPTGAFKNTILDKHRIIFSGKSERGFPSLLLIQEECPFISRYTSRLLILGIKKKKRMKPFASASVTITEQDAHTTQPGHHKKDSFFSVFFFFFSLFFFLTVEEYLITLK